MIFCKGKKLRRNDYLCTKKNEFTMIDNTFTLSGQIVDLVQSRIFPGSITVSNGKITEIKPLPAAEQRYIMPGFIDAPPFTLGTSRVKVSSMP